MASINELIVREFFEKQGYLALQPAKHLVGGRSKRPEEEADLLVYHPSVSDLCVPEHVLWGIEDLRRINRAVVCIYGGHAERIYPNMLDRFPEITRFAEKNALQAAWKVLGSQEAAAILCLPQLPASAKLKELLLKGLRKRGVHGVLLFRTILQSLIAHADTAKNYDKSDVLQMLRILKVHDLLQSAQLELFSCCEQPRRSKERDDLESS